LSDFYRIPRSHYKCGKSLVGKPCELGPAGKRCGGAGASDEENACRPLRTLHWWSRRLQLTATVLTLVLISLAWSNFGGRNTFAPGPLASPHAQLLVSKGSQDPSGKTIDAANRCSACHPGGSPESSWYSNKRDTDVAGLPTAHSAKQSELCLNCHRSKMPDAVHGSPHDLHGGALDEMLAGVARPHKSTWAKLVGHRSIDWNAHSTECSQCHKEHQGTMHTLQEMASDRCQACHQESFPSFSQGHPEFKAYPYDRLRTISFDHQRHQNLHFAKKSETFDCQKCHVQSDQVGLVGQVFRSVSFETACASCHSESIRSATQDGLIVLQLPSVDRAKLLASGHDIEPWPEQASQVNDGSIPMIMQWLLEAEPGGKDLLSQLPPSGRLGDIDMKDPSQQELLVRLTTMTKQLALKLANQGQPGLRSSVETLLTEAKSVGPVPNDWLDQFAAGLPADLFRAAAEEWFKATGPTATMGISKVRPSRVLLSSQIQAPNDDLLLGGSIPAKQDLANGDDLLAGAPNSTDLLSGPNRSQSNTGSTLESGTSLDISKFKDTKGWEQLKYGGWMIDRQRMAVVYIPTGHADAWLSRWVELEELRNRSIATSIAHERIPSTSIAQQCRVCHSIGATSPIPDGSTQRNHSIPSTISRHVSPSLTKHIAASKSETLNSDRTDSTKKSWPIAFRRVNRRSVDAFVESLFNATSENWRTARRPSNLTPITRFDHTPHLTLPITRDCRSCHTLLEPDSDRLNQTSVGSVPYGPIQEFAPMQKSNCIQCHQPNAAGESCTQCHNYHVGNQSWHRSHW
jgi:Zn finger protein HypA/HybF involved in hydrogenase expression